MEHDLHLLWLSINLREQTYQSVPIQSLLRFCLYPQSNPGLFFDHLWSMHELGSLVGAIQQGPKCCLHDLQPQAQKLRVVVCLPHCAGNVLRCRKKQPCAEGSGSPLGAEVAEVSIFSFRSTRNGLCSDQNHKKLVLALLDPKISQPDLTGSLSCWREKQYIYFIYLYICINIYFIYLYMYVIYIYNPFQIILG